MDGRESGQNLHSRNFYDGINPHGHHSSSLHTSPLPHEGLQYTMHTGIGIQPVYPFSSHWSGFSPGGSASSSESNVAPTSSMQTSTKKHGSLSQPTTTVASPSTSHSWWCSPSIYSGLSNTEMLSFPPAPWNSHEHRDSVSSTRESHGSLYQSSHLRIPNGLLSSPSLGHSYHHPNGNQLHGGTLIHFPHTSNHQPNLKKSEPWIASSNDSLPHAVSTSVSAFHHKRDQKKGIKGDPLFGKAADAKEKRKASETMSSGSADSLKDKDLFDDMNFYQNVEEGLPSLDGSEKSRGRHKSQIFEKESRLKSDPVDKSSKPSKPELIFEKSQLDKLSKDKEQTNLHRASPIISGWNLNYEKRSSHDLQNDSLTKYTGHTHAVETDIKNLPSSAPKDLNLEPHTKSSYPGEDRFYQSYQSVSSAERESVRHIPGIAGMQSYCHGRKPHLIKHEHHKEHAGAQPTSESPGLPSNLHSERITKAQATQEWVNQYPSLHRSSPESFLKTEHKAKHFDTDVKHASPLNRKTDLSHSLRSPQEKSTSSRMEKLAKKEQHYESPLNSSLPRYASTSPSSKPEQSLVTSKQAESQHHFAPAYQRSKNPFNVDFLSVSSDSEKKSNMAEQHRNNYNMTPENDNASDRVSVIKGMPSASLLNRDKAAVSVNCEEKERTPSTAKEVSRAPGQRRGPSLLDSPFSGKPSISKVSRLCSAAVQEENSSKNSDSSSSSSEEESVDEEEETTTDAVADNSTVKENGTEHDEDSGGESDGNSENKSDADETSESGSGSDSDDNDSQSQSTQDASDNTSIQESTPEKRKGGATNSHEPKRRKIVDENLLKIPIENGWKRQTRIRPTGNGDSLRGDVYYFSPCGKKIRTYPEALKYIEKNGIENLGLENFSFSTKVKVGEFLEAKQGSKFEVLTEEEVSRRHDLEKQRHVARMEKLSKKREKKKLKTELSKRAQEAKVRKKMEKQAVAEAAKISKKRHLEAIAEQRRQKKEDEKQKREMERLQKQEQLRQEKEMRARSLQQARRNKKEALQHAKMEEAIRKAREREIKRQQTVILKQQEKERRKQHLMMIRALESQRKAEERERKKEEKRLEKRILKQRKMEQRRLERSIARELKKPVDDMVLNDGKPLPEFPRVKGVNISGSAYADLLMVEEFVYCFGHVLDIDPETDFPSMADLQAALLNESSNDDSLFTAYESLLIAALHDPGVSAVTKLGISLENVEINEANVSEVLRLFILGRNEGEPHELADLLHEKPIQSLSPMKKAAILAFLVNELLCSDKIYNEMENCLEHMSNLRRDKWNMEGRIRKLKADLKSKKTEQDNQKELGPKMNNKKAKISTTVKKASQEDETSNMSMTKDDQDDEEEDEDDDDDEEEEKDDEDKDSDDEDGEDDDAGEDDQEEDEESEETDDETEPTTVEEINKRVQRLEKKHSKYRHKLFTASHTLRALCIGQDRYKRRFHILPHAGGVYVEGMESGERQENVVIKDDKDENMVEINQSTGINSNLDSTSTCVTDENKALMLHLPPNHVDKSVISPGVKSPGLESPGLKSPGLKSPGLKSPGLKSPGLKSPGLKSPGLKSPGLKSPGLKSPGLKSPGLSPGIKSPNYQSSKLSNEFDKEHTSLHSGGKLGLLSPSRQSGMISPLAFQQSTLSSPQSQTVNTTSQWFSLFPKKACDETSLTRLSIVLPSVSKGTDILAPNVRLLSQDRHFMDSVSMRSSVATHFTGHPVHHERLGHPVSSYDSNSHPRFHFPDHASSSEQYNKMHHLPGYPEGITKRHAHEMSEVDIQKLIEQDPQRAAVLLEIQSLEPAAVPEDKRYGWWRISDPDMIHKLLKSLHARGIREKMLQKSLTRHTEYACSSCKKNKQAFILDNAEEEDCKDTENIRSPKKEKQKPFKANPPGKIEDKSFPQVGFSVDKDLLIEVEELEEKMFSASLQNKTWRLSQKDSSNISYVKKESKLKSEEKPLELAKARLLCLEKGIERRYLKPPFRHEKHPNQNYVSKSNGDSQQASADGQPQSSDKDWQITPSLLLWRETVEASTSAAQLAMCISMLKDCIAWERSIMKVFCIECRKGDNEELLLLCDQCDRGCHTYCCHPKLDKIPDGDWFCRECIMIASGSDQCYGCQGSTGRRLKCEFCPRYYHLHCVDPPLQKTPRSPWACPVCKKARLKSKRPTKKRKRPEDEFETLSAYDKFENPSRSSSGRKKKEKMNNRKEAMAHMAPCRQMLAEMERHECSWPFLVPVNAKQFPEYYQIIRNPMDFHTMKVKLRDFQYSSRDEFAADARLVFRNCDIFNEDDSEVGQAGKRMLKFFENRWIEVLNKDNDAKARASTAVQSGSEDSDSDENDSSGEAETDDEE